MKKQNSNPSKQQQQSTLFDLAGAPLAPTVRTVRYGDKVLTTTNAGPLVGQGTTTDAATGAHIFQPGTASDAVGTIATTTTATPSQPVQIIPDTRTPERRIKALGGDNASQLEVKDLADFEDAIQRLYEHMKGGDVFMDVEQVRAFTGQSSGDRRARDLRKCQLSDGRWVWYVSQRVKGRRGGVYHIEHHDHRQPDGNNGRNMGGDTL